MNRVHLLGVLGALGLFAPPLTAQTAPTCQEAAAQATQGVPSEDALAVLFECPSVRGPAYASYLRRLAVVGDTNALEVPFGAANVLQDAEVHEALRAVAADPAAVVPARVLSILALINHEAGSALLSYRELTTVPEGGTCVVVHLDGGAIVSGTPLPAGHRQQANLLAIRLEADPSVPPAVRSAARCLSAETSPIDE